MKVRNHNTMIGIATAMAILGAASRGNVAYAEQTSRKPTPAPVKLEAAPEVVASPTKLDAAWASTLWSVVHGMQRNARLERAAVLQTLSGEVEDDADADAEPPIVLPESVSVSMVPRAIRKALAQSPWELGPVAVHAVTESPVDTRGENGVVLGARLPLPWFLP